MADQFATWQQLLKIAEVNKTKAAMREAITAAGIQILESEPFSGYFRCAATKDGPLLPVAIWREGATVHVFRNGEPVKLERVWPYCVWNPVSYDWYEEYTEKSGKWPDEPAAVEPSAAEKHADEVAAQAENLPVGTKVEVRAEQEDNKAAKYEKQIDAKIKEADDIDLKTKVDGDKVQAIRSDITKLAGQADKTREALVRPHLDAQRDINATWAPIVNKGKNAAKDIDKRLGALSRKLTAEAAAALAVQAQAAAPADVEGPGETQPFVGEQIGGNHPPVEQPAPPPAVEPVQFKGATGRASRLPTTKAKVAVIEDYDKLFAHIKAFTELKAVMQKIAQRLVDGGEAAPGVKVEEERDDDAA